MGGDVDAGYLEAIPALDPVRAWIVEHDQSRVFLVLYIGLAVVLSLWISLFWLVAVVGAHLVLELIRQSHLQIGARRIVLESAWELKLDVALVLFALALSLYMETVLGVVGLQGAARLGSASRAAARFASWERVLRGVALSADDAAQVARAVAIRRSDGDAPAADAQPRPDPAIPAGWARPWTVGTWIAIVLGAACILLIGISPTLTDHTTSTAISRILAELRPFP
jgi:hypothetical protein